MYFVADFSPTLIIIIIEWSWHHFSKERFRLRVE
jgi:hypothetical protein